jgi:aldose 1-epimerase
MRQCILENENWQVEISPEFGASIVNGRARLSGDWLSVMRTTAPEVLSQGNVSKMSSFLLVPFSNRLPDARFTFRGKTYQLKPNTPEGNAQHGDVRRRPWRVQASSATQLECSLNTREFDDFNYPFPFSCAVSYVLNGVRFETQFNLTNTGEEAMPVGFGFHPYFSRTLTAPDEPVELSVRLTHVYEELVPTRTAVPTPSELSFARIRPLADTVLNHCFTGWDGKALIRWARSGIALNIEASEPLRHVILFSPAGEPFFAVEPVSNATNGFNLYAAGYPGSGTIVLEPGETTTGRFALILERPEP